MSRLDRLKEKDRKSNLLSVDNYDEDSAARTRPFSFEEIMLRRRNKELLENVKDPAKEAWNISPEGSLEKTADHFESPSKHHKIPSFSMEKHASEELVNVSSRKKIKSTIVKEDDLTEGRDRANNILETKSSAGLNNKGWMTEEKNGKERRGSRKIEQMSKNSENKHSRDSVNKDSYEEKDRSKSAGKLKKVNRIEDEENHNEYHTERKHGKDRHDGGKIKKWLSNDFEEVPEKKHHRDSDKHIHEEGRAKYEREINKETRATHEREIKRKYRNGDDEIQDRNATRKQDIAKHHNPHIHERKNRQEKVKSHYEESTMKRRRSRSREHEDRRRSPSFSPRAHRNTYKDGERKDLSMLSLADSSRKKHPDDKNRVSTNGSSRRSRSREREDRRRSPSFSPRAHRKVYQDGERKDLSMLLTDSSRKKHSDDKNRVSTNGSSSHHRGYRHSDSASGLGGYSPRKRKSETDNKTPSPSKHSSEKKRAGWDLPPVGTDPSPAVVSSGFQLSNNNSVLSSMHDVTSATSLDLSIVKPLPVTFLNAVSTGKNVSIDSVQLTQATRPMRRLYIENLPASASEKVVMDCFNNLLLSASVNLVQQTRPCISCIVSL
jgi:splicing factor U2AF subunit